MNVSKGMFKKGFQYNIKLKSGFNFFFFLLTISRSDAALLLLAGITVVHRFAMAHKVFIVVLEMTR